MYLSSSALMGFVSIVGFGFNPRFKRTYRCEYSCLLLSPLLRPSATSEHTDPHGPSGGLTLISHHKNVRTRGFAQLEKQALKLKENKAEEDSLRETRDELTQRMRTLEDVTTAAKQVQ